MAWYGMVWYHKHTFLARFFLRRLGVLAASLTSESRALFRFVVLRFLRVLRVLIVSVMYACVYVCMYVCMNVCIMYVCMHVCIMCVCMSYNAYKYE